MLVALLIEVILFATLLILLVTQVALPLITGRPMFPLFRRRAKLETELAGAYEEHDLQRIQDRIETVRNSNNKTRESEANGNIRENTATGV